MSKIIAGKTTEIRTTQVKQIHCTLDKNVNVHFNVIVTNTDGSISVSLADLTGKNALPRQIEMKESEFLFWKEIFEKVIKGQKEQGDSDAN